MKLRKFILGAFWSIIQKFAPAKIYHYMACTASTLNTVIEAFEITVETWPCLYMNSCILLCFYSCVLIFSHFQDEKKDITQLWPKNITIPHT